jgi:hypothetical protein
VDIIHNITCETLLISAPRDEVQEVAILPWFLKVPKIKWVELVNSTHLGMYEEEARYFVFQITQGEGVQLISAQNYRYIRVITNFLTA